MAAPATCISTGKRLCATRRCVSRRQSAHRRLSPGCPRRASGAPRERAAGFRPPAVLEFELAEPPVRKGTPRRDPRLATLFAGPTSQPAAPEMQGMVWLSPCRQQAPRRGGKLQPLLVTAVPRNVQVEVLRVRMVRGEGSARKQAAAAPVAAWHHGRLADQSYATSRHQATVLASSHGQPAETSHILFGQDIRAAGGTYSAGHGCRWHAPFPGPAWLATAVHRSAPGGAFRSAL